ncbi:MAG: ATP-dependent RecD-like DNA helicase [Acetivibrionales bacterium]|nr:ATP-dependent RecD-like DNA helicase [Clostridiaceae bacterium]
MEQIKGTINSIRYTNTKNGYTVCDLKSDNNTHITLVGIMPMLVEGENVVATGEFVSHPDYGRQFKVEECQRDIPTREEGIIQYLSSGFIKGLGKVTAKNIVEKFKEKTFEIFQFEPYKLADIKGITPQKALFYGQAFLEHENMRNIIMLMQKYGVSSEIAVKIWNIFGAHAEEEVRKNPYRLSEADIGLGFSICDRIAFSLGLEPSSLDRLKSALLYLLSTQIAKGHTYSPKEELIKLCVKLTRVPEELINNAFDALLLEEMIFVERQYPDRVYTSDMIDAERYCARKLSGLNTKRDDYWVKDCDSLLSEYEKNQNISLDTIQLKAIKCALSQRICVITGGPGTGKTTIIKTLIEIFESKGLSTVLAAPTGRAAKRVSETSGYEAKTIHRLLEVGYSIENNEKPYFMKNEDNPLLADVLIIDEASMIDIIMMEALLKAFPWEASLILVGDADQLPSVGPGKVLSDIIESGSIPVTQLETIYRQMEESRIITNAHLINQGKMPSINEEEGDFFFIPKLSSKDVTACITDLCINHITERFGLEPIKDIQVLSPMRKGDTGVRNLNTILQKAFNPESEDKPQKQFGNTVFRLGDRVMQIRNDYSLPWTLTDENGFTSDGLGVYNGDMGIIIDIDSKEELITVCFDDNRICEYRFDRLESLEHAFAITVHKSQGTEFPAVVISLFGIPRGLICRNLLYTAVTRAKKLVVLVGNPTIMEEMVRNINERERYSGLKERLM